MRKLKTTLAAVALLLFGAAGCADLEVQNPNDPAREQVLVTAGDVESLIAGAFNTWYNGMHYYQTFWVSNASFQSASTAANFGNIDQSPIPRVSIINDNAYQDYHYTVERTWQRAYRSLAAAADGLRTMANDESIGQTLNETTAGAAERIQAFGKFTQALGHASLALWYDQAFIVDENTELVDESGSAIAQTPVTYEAMMEAAVGYFQEAIDLAEGATWSIPSAWMSVDVPASEFTDLMYTMRATYRASMPRTPDEDPYGGWQAVLDDLDAGLTDSFVMVPDYYTTPFYNGAYDINGGPNGWAAEVNYVIGMADQSGNYERWLNMPVSDKIPWFGDTQDDDPVLIITPDERFPQGNTLAEQKANWEGTYYRIPQDLEGVQGVENGDVDYDVAEHFTRPARGTWRWSYYHYPIGFDYWYGNNFDVPLVTEAEINLLRAEALLELGGTANEQAAADLINITREAAGLSAADATAGDHGNTSCVPNLPDGDPATDNCGDLFEMMKWEKRLETKNVGVHGISWYWDGRRWGDLYHGTPLQWPIPAGELETLQMDHYTFGGVTDDQYGAPVSTYAYPGEG